MTIEALTFELRSQLKDAEAKYRESRSDVAKTEFLRALAKFTDLVVRGQVPKEFEALWFAPLQSPLDKAVLMTGTPPNACCNSLDAEDLRGRHATARRPMMDCTATMSALTPGRS
jgi:hypothetical protein